MAKKRFGREQVVTKRRQIELLMGEGRSLQQTLREAGITDATYYRWRKEYGGFKGNQAKRLKELERENARLKKRVADLSLEKAILKDVAEGNFEAPSDAEKRWITRSSSTGSRNAEPAAFSVSLGAPRATTHPTGR